MIEKDNKAELIQLLNDQRRQSAIFSILLIISMVVAAYFVFQLWDTRQELVVKTKELDASLKDKELALVQLELMNDSIEKTVVQLTMLKVLSDSLKEVATQQITSLMNRGIQSKSAATSTNANKYAAKNPLNQKEDMMALTRNMTNSSLIISVHSVGVDEKDIKLAIESLRSSGYYAEACNSFKLGAAPKWMATVPTVFYYSEQSKEQAVKMANILGKSLSLTFNVTKGSGFGVMKGQERNTFFIHLIAPYQNKR
jgi:hypothetical protein